MNLDDRVTALEEAVEVLTKWSRIALYVSIACAMALGLEITDVLR